MKTSFAFLLALSVVGGPGCAVSVVDGSGASNDGSGDTTGGTQITSGAGGSIANPAACLMTASDQAGFALTYAGQPLMADPDGSTYATIESVVVASAPGTLVVGDAVITASGAGAPAVMAPPGASVRIRYFSQPTVSPVAGGSGSATLFYVENLPSSPAVPNTVSETQRVWLEVENISIGQLKLPDGFGDPIDTGDGATCAGSDPLAHRSGLSVSIPGANNLEVGENNVGTVDATGALAGHYTVHNGENRQSDSGRELSYWITGE